SVASPGGPTIAPGVPISPVGPIAPVAPAIPVPGAPPPSTLVAAGTSAAIPLRAGIVVRVTGAGDCLNVRSAPSMSGTIVTCLSDGAVGAIAQGPVQADGRTWWQLAGLGWAAGDYLSGISIAVGALQVGTGIVIDAGANDCLNLRAAPSMAAQVLTCLPSGAR